VARPTATFGTPVGYTDWRFAVEIALPESGASVYDVAVYDTGVYSVINWFDITDSVRGIQWHRGADEPGGRPQTGTAEITLDNRLGQWTPWADVEAAAYRRPGTLLRWSTFSAAAEAWVPQMAGIVESWTEGSDALGNECWVTVTLTETVALLANIDNNAGSSYGAGQYAGARCDRLLSSARWTMGLYDEAASTIPLLATDQSLNRLGELHLTADSSNCFFRAHRSGIAMLEAVDPVDHPSYNPPLTARYDTAVYNTDTYASTASTIWYQLRASSYFYSGITIRPDAGGISAPDVNGQVELSLVYDADSLVSLNDTDMVRNDVRIARVGGVVQVSVNEVSQGRYGQRSYTRSDLKTATDADVLTIANKICNRRANRVLRVDTVDLFGRPENLHGIMVVDVGDPVTVVLPDNDLTVEGHIASVEHNVSPRSGSALLWTCTLGLETYPGFV
jgi:hypothetical protein